MVPLLWATIAAIVALIVIIGEYELGLDSDSATTIAPHLLWYVLPPLVVVIAMVHERGRHTAAFHYGAAIKTGMLTALASSCSLTVVWLAVVLLLIPSYHDHMVDVEFASAKSAGLQPALILQRIEATSMLFTMPAVALVGFFLPLISGSIAAFVTAFGVRKSASNSNR